VRVNDTAEILWVAGGSELWICVLELRSDRGRKVRLRDKAGQNLSDLMAVVKLQGTNTRKKKNELFVY